jgi:hypothetical protein
MANEGSKKAKKSVITSLEFLRLRHWNTWLAGIYALEGAAIFILSAAYSVPVIINYLAQDPINSAVAGHTVLSAATRQEFNVSIPGLIAIFFLIAALVHALLATVYRGRYESELAKGFSIMRWIEYGLGSGLMLVVIGLLSGVYDASTLSALFGLMLVMSLFGLVTELTSTDGRLNWLTYWSGAFVGLVSWLIIGFYAFNASYYGGAHIPTYVYWIYGTMLICAVGFALNMYMRCREQGKWVRYEYVERSFMALSLITKTLLAWQIFAGLLRP